MTEWNESRWLADVEDVPLPGDELPTRPPSLWLCSKCGVMVTNPKDPCDCEDEPE